LTGATFIQETHLYSLTILSFDDMWLFRGIHTVYYLPVTLLPYLLISSTMSTPIHKEKVTILIQFHYQYKP